MFWTWFIITGNQGAEKEGHEKRREIKMSIETKAVRKLQDKKKNKNHW